MEIIKVILIIMLATIAIVVIPAIMRQKKMIFRDKSSADVFMKFNDFVMAYTTNPTRYKLEEWCAEVLSKPVGISYKTIGYIEFNFIDRLRYHHWRDTPHKIDHAYFDKLRIRTHGKPVVDTITNDINEWMNKKSSESD